MKKLPCLLVVLGVLLLITGCGKDYPPDSSSVKYASRSYPGGKLDVVKYLEPERMNLFYFYADW